jgi:hypothetical protein
MAAVLEEKTHKVSCRSCALCIASSISSALLHGKLGVAGEWVGAAGARALDSAELHPSLRDSFLGDRRQRGKAVLAGEGRGASIF